MLFTFLALAFAFGIAWYFLRSNQKNYPTGPRGLPIIGNLHQLSEEPYKDYIRLQKKYGDVFSLQLGSFRAIVLSDNKLIKEAFRLAPARPFFPHFNNPDTNSQGGMGFSDGKLWEEQRRFVLKNLRDFGFGKKTMESAIMDEVKILVDSIRKEELGKAICTTEMFDMAVFNALWSIIAGERASQSEETFRKLIRHMTTNSRDAKTFALLGFFPQLAKWFPQIFGLNKFMDNFLPIFDHMKEVAISHKKTFQEGVTRDFIDCYLEHIQTTKDKESSFYKDSGDSNLVMVLNDLFFGGTETSSVTLSWMCLLLAHNPEAQEKFNEEIKNVVGNNRWPSLSDRPNMPFTEATLLEVLRYSSLAPITMRRPLEDIQISHYHIPKGTVVLANFYALNNDEKVWGDPENFRPERFLSEDGKTIKAFERGYMLPFGTGKRTCPGESMARDNLFLFGTSLFKHFRVTVDPAESNPKIDFFKGTLLRLPLPHKLVLLDRHLKH